MVVFHTGSVGPSEETGWNGQKIMGFKPIVDFLPLGYWLVSSEKVV